MKRPIEKREKVPDPVMRFFTRELYREFNSTDDAVADRAHEAWEQADRDYQRHLKTLVPKMPPDVSRVSELCLHDAELLAFERDPRSFIIIPEPFQPAAVCSKVLLLSLKLESTMHNVVYFLWGDVQQHPSPRDWPFASRRKYWMYDEVDRGGSREGEYCHRILFSDGSIAEIPFVSVFISSFLLPTSDFSKQIA